MFIAKNHERLPQESSSYSIEGIKAHNAAAAGLLMGEEAMVAACEGDAAMVKHLKGYVEFVESKLVPGDEIHIESKVPVWYYPEKSGYIDACIIGKKRMYIVDLKYGEGIPVFARGNPQLAIYCQCVVEWMSVLHDFHDDYLITVAIYQPRARGQAGQDGPFSTWSLTVRELRAFVERIANTAHRILSGEEYTFQPSDDNCRWCRAVSICSARAKQLFGDHDEPILPEKPKPLEQIYLDDPARLKPSMVAFLIKNKSAIIGWLEKVTKYGYAALKNGKPELLDNAWKLVPGREGNRTYTDPELAKKFLLEHLPKEVVQPPSSVISPKRAEDALAEIYGKDIAKALIADFVTRAPGADTLAPIDDPRDSVHEDHAADFDHLDHDLL